MGVSHFRFSSISVVFWFALPMLPLPSFVVFERVGFGADLDRFLYEGFLRLLSDGGTFAIHDDVRHTASCCN